MSEKVKYNLSVVRAKRFSDNFLWFFLGCLLILLIALSFFSVSSSSSYTGIYSCNANICQIKTVIDLNTMYEIESNWQLLVHDELEDFNVIQFGDFVEQESFVGQEVVLRVSKQDYYNNQTISFQIIKNKKNFWNIFLDTLKGGDA